jgi:hypothetical protein
MGQDGNLSVGAEKPETQGGKKGTGTFIETLFDLLIPSYQGRNL